MIETFYVLGYPNGFGFCSVDVGGGIVMSESCNLTFPAISPLRVIECELLYTLVWFLLIVPGIGYCVIPAPCAPIPFKVREKSRYVVSLTPSCDSGCLLEFSPFNPGTNTN